MTILNERNGVLSINYQLLNIRSCSYRLNDFRDGKVLAVLSKYMCISEYMKR